MNFELQVNLGARANLCFYESRSGRFHFFCCCLFAISLWQDFLLSHFLEGSPFVYAIKFLCLCIHTIVDDVTRGTRYEGGGLRPKKNARGRKFAFEFKGLRMICLTKIKTRTKTEQRFSSLSNVC
jgi:hypothetical protein